MKILFAITFLLFTLTSTGQKVYLDKNHIPLIPLTDSIHADYYKLVEYTDGTNAYRETNYYISGEKESESHYIKVNERYVKEGKAYSWYKNGQLKSNMNFSEDKIIGKSNTWYENGQLKSDVDHYENSYKNIVTYWENGTVKRKDVFNEGKLKEGKCYNRSGNEIKHYTYEIMPQYKGGDMQLLKDIANNSTYPEKSKKAGIQGRVVVRFVVNQDGTISSPSILVGVNHELNNEAMRVVQTLNRFKPGFLDGEPIPVYYMVPITFRLQ